MRNFEERKTEIFRRSEKRIKERIRKRNSILAAGIPMCLFFIVLSITSFPAKEAVTDAGIYEEEVTDGGWYEEEVTDGGWYEEVVIDGGWDEEVFGDAMAWPEGAAGCEERYVSFIPHYIRTDGYNEEVRYPVVKIIRSVDELREYYNTNKDKYDLERKTEVYSDTTIGFLDACDKYDETYFKNQILVVVLFEEGSGSVRHNVETVKVTQDDKLYISICAIVPEAGTDDMAEWHILIEPEEGIDVVNEADVIVDVYAEYRW